MTTSDRTIQAIGLVRHPKPDVIANNLDHLAATLRRDAGRAIDAASVLAARGWAAGTLGDGGGRSGATIEADGERIPVTSVEAAALHHDRWSDVDQRLAKLLRILWATTVQLETTIADVLAHADDADELPAASGTCQACGKVVRSDGRRPEYLRAGLCDACRKHWQRSGIVDRGQWMLARRAMLGHREGAQVLANRFRQALDQGALEAG